MDNNDLYSLFQFGTPAKYLDSNNTLTSCRVFVDIGWRDSLSGFDTQVAEITTLITLSLEDVPNPKANDEIHIDNTKYKIMSVQAQDEVIAVLHVKKI